MFSEQQLCGNMTDESEMIASNSSLHSIMNCLFEKDAADIDHTTIKDQQFWTLSFPLKGSREMERELFEIGHVKNVVSSIRLTKETYLPQILLYFGY